MPELAEVDYYRRQWDPGLGQKITRLHLHPDKRVFRGADTAALKKIVRSKFAHSEAAGKQMLFHFSGGLWIGLHLGMTGKLSVGPKDYQPAKHDHLILFQKERALVFTDPRQFGRVQVHRGKDAPDWWTAIGPGVTSSDFTLARMSEFLARHKKLPIKGALLSQKGFPGIGNWMADEILWRARIAPARACERLSRAELKNLWKEVRFVAREALLKIGKDFGDPPRGWLFHEHWKRQGICPRHKTALRKDTIAGRTTAWCPKCQK